MNDGPHAFAVRGGFPAPRFSDGIDDVQSSPPDVRRADQPHHGCLRAPIPHLQPQQVIAVAHLDRATSRGVDHGVRHEFREHQHSIVARAATALEEPGRDGAPRNPTIAWSCSSDKAITPAGPSKGAASNDDRSNDADEAATSASG